MDTALSDQSLCCELEKGPKLSLRAVLSIRLGRCLGLSDIFLGTYAGFVSVRLLRILKLRQIRIDLRT